MVAPGRSRSIAGLLLLLILSLPLCYADELNNGFNKEVNIVDLIDRLGGELLWDPVLQRGIVNRGRTSVVFQVGIPYLLKDFTLLRDIDPPRRRDDGAVVLDEKGAESFLALFATEPTPGGFRISTVILDPGHGGKDPGTIGTHSFGDRKLTLQEKAIVLKVAGMIHGRLVERFPQKNILMTRDDDRYLALEERTEFANRIELGEQEAMIFLSVHANASLNRRASGFEVWYLPPEYRREILDPDELEGEQQSIAPILNSILEEEFTVESILLARDISSGLERSIGTVSENRGLKEESWFVVRNAKMPSVLVEIGFVTNPEEAQKLETNAHLQKISDGIYNGLVEYIEKFEEGGN